MKWLRYSALALVSLIVLAVVILLGLSTRESSKVMVASVEIARPPAEVWPWLTETEKLKAWIGWLKEVRPLTPPPDRVGSRSVWVMEDQNNNGQKMEMTDELLEYDPPRRLKVSIRSDEGFSGEALYTLEDLGNGRTLLTQRSSFVFDKWFFKLLSPLIMGSAQKKAAADMQTMKARVESARLQ